MKKYRVKFDRLQRTFKDKKEAIKFANRREDEGYFVHVSTVRKKKRSPWGLGRFGF